MRVFIRFSVVLARPPVDMGGLGSNTFRGNDLGSGGGVGSAADDDDGSTIGGGA